MLITGLGVTTAVGQGVDAVTAGLLGGKHNFGVMQRPGRQAPTSPEGEATTAFLGAEISDLQLPTIVPRSLTRTASFTAQVALTTLAEAWQDAGLDDVDPTRIGLIVGGSNVQQRELELIHQKYAGKAQFLRPTYAMSFMDSDIGGMCTELFGIKGLAMTVGGASASGQVAILQAANAIKSGQVDVCIALGALMDLSHWECQGFRSLGAMGSHRYAESPELACRPFDTDRDGFIFGEACGAIVLEKEPRSTTTPYAKLAGWGMSMDANRNPDPSLAGEKDVIAKALAMADLRAGDIDYVNPHGTGSHIGDETELAAIAQSGLSHAYLNATKSIFGHGLTAAGAVEFAATLLQMRAGKLHPTRNLVQPMLTDYNWVQHDAVTHSIQNALTMSMGFGGVNTALCVSAI